MEYANELFDIFPGHESGFMIGKKKSQTDNSTGDTRDFMDRLAAIRFDGGRCIYKFQICMMESLEV